MAKTKVVTNEILKGIMIDTVTARPPCKDLDTCLSAGVYTVIEARNTPGSVSYGVLKVEVSTHYGLQTFYTREEKPHIWSRTFIVGSEGPDFKPWVALSPT